MPKVSKDLTGMRFGMLIAQKRAVRVPPRYLCKCDCGGEKIIAGYSLQSGNTKSCGCAKLKKRKDITGMRFGRLVVERNNEGTPEWICRCDCGNLVSVTTGSITSGNTKSCGCYRLDQLRSKLVKHGPLQKERFNLELRSWRGMIQRCTNPKHHKYKLYGGRGIKVCERWRTFQKFFDDMGPKPSKNHTIERRDGNGDYELGNCEWALSEVQNNNRSSVRRILYKGVNMTARDLINRYGSSVGHRVLSKRIFERNWDVERALTTPPIESEGRMVSDESKEKMRQAAFKRIYKR